MKKIIEFFLIARDEEHTIPSGAKFLQALSIYGCIYMYFDVSVEEIELTEKRGFMVLETNQEYETSSFSHFQHLQTVNHEDKVFHVFEYRKHAKWVQMMGRATTPKVLKRCQTCGWNGTVHENVYECPNCADPIITIP